MRSHSKLVWHRAFLPRSELLFQEVLKAVLEVAIVSFWTLIISERLLLHRGEFGFGAEGALRAVTLQAAHPGCQLAPPLLPQEFSKI